MDALGQYTCSLRVLRGFPGTGRINPTAKWRRPPRAGRLIAFITVPTKPHKHKDPAFQFERARQGGFQKPWVYRILVLRDLLGAYLSSHRPQVGIVLKWLPSLQYCADRDTVPFVYTKKYVSQVFWNYGLVNLIAVFSMT